MCDSMLVAVGMHVPVIASCMYICYLYLCLLVSIHIEIVRLKKKNICGESAIIEIKPQGEKVCSRSYIETIGCRARCYFI